MPLSQIYFSDIQTSDLLYYDPEFEDLCYRFCRERDIDCLPSLDDPFVFFRKTDTGFREEEVMPDRMVDGNSSIFKKPLLERFLANSLLFVYMNNELTGVVHFSDYNRPAVNAHLYELLSAYERSLRKLLLLHGLKNEDMLEYFRDIVEKVKSSGNNDQISRYARNLKGFENKRAENEKLPAFERFYLLDLIELANYRGVITVSPGTNDLRNMIMHAHELVYMYDANRGDYIYNFASFEFFFSRVGILLQDYKRVNNKIAFSEFKEG